jgi:aminopeptidase N
LYERFLKATVPTEKENLLTSLGCTRETWLLKSLLEKSLSEEYGIKKQDIGRVFSVVSANLVGESIAFDFVRDNWKRIKE